MVGCLPISGLDLEGSKIKGNLFARRQFCTLLKLRNPIQVATYHIMDLVFVLKSVKSVKV